MFPDLDSAPPLLRGCLHRRTGPYTSGRPRHSAAALAHARELNSDGTLTVRFSYDLTEPHRTNGGGLPSSWKSRFIGVLREACNGLKILPQFAHRSAPDCSTQRNQPVTSLGVAASCTEPHEISKPTATKTATSFCVAVLTAEQLTLNLNSISAQKRIEEHPATESTDYAQGKSTTAHEARNSKTN